MPESPLLTPPYWTRSPSIPIHLDITEELEPEAHNHDSENICRKYAVNSRQRTPCSPAPPSYRSVAPTSSNTLFVPTLSLETSRPAHPTSKSNPASQPRVRFRRLASPLSPCTTIDDGDFTGKAHTSCSSIPNTPADEINWKSKLGLGIPAAQFEPDPSPIRSPGSENLATAEKGEFTRNTSPNLAERIEQKLWNYSASGNVAKRWLLEIISWTVSAICMVAIIIPLFILKNKPVPSTWPITLNAYIAVLSRVASAALLLPASEALGQLKWSWFQGNSKKMWDFELFDNASRGPWGSFLLIVRTKGTTLAALGAAITIFAMALDPFFQQVIHNTERLQLLPLDASIPRVVQYAPPITLEFSDGSPVLNRNKDLDSSMAQFFFDYGVQKVQVGNNTLPDVQLSCPTSDCTWEPYQSLGFCSECADIADILEFGCYQTQLDWITTANVYDPYENGTTCGWFLNATSPMPILMSGYQVNSSTNEPIGQILTTRLMPLTTIINRRPLFGRSIKFKDHRLPLADFVAVTPPDGPEIEKVLASVFRRERPRATECVVSWCVKTIESSYHHADYTETVTDYFINKTVGPDPWKKIKVEPPPKDRPNTVQYIYSQDITLSPDAKNDSLTYGASNDTAFDILTLFDTYLPSLETVNINGSNDFALQVKNKDPGSNSNVSTPVMTYRMRYEHPYARVSYNNPWRAPRNITKHMEDLATTMTNIIRTRSKDNVTGKAYSEETYVEVRWPWLSLPVGLLLMTFIFLVATIMRTSKEIDNIGVWKTSAIATLLYGLPDSLQRKLVASQADGTPRAKAKELNARMLPKQGWRISGLLSPSPSVHKFAGRRLPPEPPLPPIPEKDGKPEVRVFKTYEPVNKLGSREPDDDEIKDRMCKPPPGWI